MAKVCPQSRERGFSLVELLVALVFIMVLMSGMANVYKASISNYYTSGESLASVRRNRMSMDLLVDDLNTSSMFLTDLSIPPALSQAVPPFHIIPNATVTGAGTGDPATTDELYFYLDQPLPFEGTLPSSAPTQRNASELVSAGVAPTATDRTFDVECGSSTYASQVKAGHVMVFKDSWESVYIANPTPNGSKVTVVAGATPNSMITGSGATGLPTKAKHLPSSKVVFIVPNQMVRYRIQMLKLDPGRANGIPCLVRDQGAYNATTFTPTEPQQIVSENVSGFKVYVSADRGTNWAGLGATYSGFSAGWDLGIRTALDAQLATSGRPDFKTTRGNDHWFRSIPTLVRVDVTTRTATQRAEYSTDGTTAAYRNLTQSLVFVPRHSGLTMN